MSNSRAREFTSEAIADFAFELAGMALRAGVEADLFNYEFDNRGLPLHRGPFPASVAFTVSDEVQGVAHFQRSDDYTMLGRVKYFNLYKMAWLNEDPIDDDHSPIATVEFFYDQKQRAFRCGPQGPTVTFQPEGIDSICGIGVLPPYKTLRPGD